jgi:hypothetical protein
MAPTIQGDVAGHVKAVSRAWPKIGGHFVVRPHFIPTFAGNRAATLTGGADVDSTTADKSDEKRCSQ